MEVPEFDELYHSLQTRTTTDILETKISSIVTTEDTRTIPTENWRLEYVHSFEVSLPAKKHKRKKLKSKKRNKENIRKLIHPNRRRYR